MFLSLLLSCAAMGLLQWTKMNNNKHRDAIAQCLIWPQIGLEVWATLWLKHD